ncbi:MAG: putative transcriptional regulator [Parcubacteria group bacterium GW2011_GWF2_38_76]|nr:MAG: putative transcriptional regulator [Parcubacteria group bacterium GW2011_GWF2_38_76]HBM45402.1 hypothetical protein [Patescibacteria group bacterium]
MEILSKLFGSENRVKVLRLFLTNPNSTFTKEEISKRSRVGKDNTVKEINVLRKIKFLEEKKMKLEGRVKKIIIGFKLDQNFSYADSLRDLLLGSDVLKGEDLLKKLKGIGKVKLVITAGIFIDNENSPADLLIVGDNIKRKSLLNIIKAIESEVGREIKYSVFDTEDFKYRLTVYDKFVRQIMDFPHNKILDRLYE